MYNTRNMKCKPTEPAKESNSAKKRTRLKKVQKNSGKLSDFCCRIITYNEAAIV